MKNEKMIFAVIMICIISSAFILNFSYGLYKNFQTAKNVETENLSQLALEINKEAAPTHAEVRQFVESLSDETVNQMMLSELVNESKHLNQNKEYVHRECEN